jgi:hypothetical protein
VGYVYSIMANKTKSQSVDVIQTQELPAMNMRITKASADFVTLNIDISCSAYDIKQCKEGITFLLKQVSHLETGGK